MKQLLFCVFFFASGQHILAQLTSSDLPVIVINTNGQEIVDDPKIMADMGIIWNDNNARNNITDPFNHYNGKIGIEIRGQSSQMFPMKSYSIELRNGSGNSVSRSVFGMPSESDWVLYAPYNDKTLMHNFLAYTISRSLGHWSANCRYVELVINGEYRGVYVFMEKIKRKSGRVNIPSMSSSDNDGDAVTGGYIFSIDKEPNGWFSQYAAGKGTVQYSYVYPKPENVTAQQKVYIKNYTDSFENALVSSNYQDKQNGWRKFADENSFIDYFIVNEVSRNVDGYRLSAYFNKDRYSNGGKIKAGPVWDYDLAFRNADYCNGSNTDGWSYAFNGVCPDDFWQVPFWWDKLMSDTAFESNLRCRWKALRTAALSKSSLYHLIDSVVTLTTEARQRHFAQWPVLGQYVWPNPQPIPQTYTEEIQTLKQWLSARLEWIDKNIPNRGVCADYPADASGTFIIQTMPNPYSGNEYITLLLKEAQSLKVRLTDVTGSTSWLGTYDLSAGSSYIQIPAARLATGIYFIECMNSKGERLVKKILITHQ